jgi:hypothetical protein
MNCQQLAARIEKLQPGIAASDTARMCLLLSNYSGDVNRLSDEATFQEAWQDVSLKLQAADDQHAAVTDELAEMAAGDPESFSPEQTWVLVRAIKVQSQILSLYLGQPQPDY